MVLWGGDSEVGITTRYRLEDLYCSPNIVRVIKSRIRRWAGNVARMGRVEACTVQGFGRET